jgi:hypothetical protein
VQVVFDRALEEEGLAAEIERRALSPVEEDAALPILLAVSDNGPQMTSGSTAEYMALCSIVQHFGRPGTPTDQAPVESFFSHLKDELPHLEQIRDRVELEIELERQRVYYNTVRLHTGIGYVTPDDEQTGRADAIRKARREGSSSRTEGTHRLPSQAGRQVKVRWLGVSNRVWLKKSEAPHAHRRCRSPKLFRSCVYVRFISLLGAECCGRARQRCGSETARTATITCQPLGDREN